MRLWNPINLTFLYDPRHTTGLTQLHGKPKHKLSLKALLVWLGFLLLTLAGTLIFLAVLIG